MVTCLLVIKNHGGLQHALGAVVTPPALCLCASVFMLSNSTAAAVLMYARSLYYTTHVHVHICVYVCQSYACINIHIPCTQTDSVTSSPSSFEASLSFDDGSQAAIYFENACKMRVQANFGGGHH